MKKVALFFLLVMALPGYACDVCGCANSGAYFGLMPQSHKSLIGVRYQRMSFKTHQESDILRTEETFNITEVYARFFPLKRVQVMAFLPYRFDQQVTMADTKKQNGIGDVTVLVNYNVLNTLMDKESSGSFTHTLLVGGGIKAPTGRFKYDENNLLDVANANFQAGTGSTDFIVNSFYTINYGDWGLAVNASGKFNTTNAQKYRFGNQYYGTMDLYRSFKVGNITLTPNVGVYAEKSLHGSQDGEKIKETGGYLVNATAGVTLFANRWTLGISGQNPISQKLSIGHVQANARGLIQVGWLF